MLNLNLFSWLCVFFLSVASIVLVCVQSIAQTLHQVGNTTPLDLVENFDEV